MYPSAVVYSNKHIQESKKKDQSTIDSILTSGFTDLFKDLFIGSYYRTLKK